MTRTVFSNGVLVVLEIDGVKQEITDDIRKQHKPPRFNKSSKPQPNCNGNEVATQGVGTELKKLISKLGLRPKPGCKCAQHITEMNQNGAEWCSENIDTIIGWLKEEADRAKLAFFAPVARILVKRAIAITRRSTLQVSADSSPRPQ